MHTVVFGWFGASAVWFIPLLWRIVKSVLPNGGGLRGPGTIRLWLGFFCVLLASCALEAALFHSFAFASQCRPSRPRAAARPGRTCRRRQHAGCAERGGRCGRRVSHQLAVALRVPMARDPWLGKRRVRPGPRTRMVHATGTDSPRETGACPGIARQGGNAGGKHGSWQFQGGERGWERCHDFWQNLARCSGTRLADCNATPKRALSAADRLASAAGTA